MNGFRGVARSVNAQVESGVVTVVGSVFDAGEVDQ